MQNKMSMRIWLFIFSIVFLSLACTYGSGVVDDDERWGIPDPTIEVVQPVEPDKPATTQPPATQTVGPGDEIIPLTLSFSASDMQDLPVYRATLSNPFDVYKSGPGPWAVEQTATRTDDLQTMGEEQPGSVTQNSTFSGSYDPATGTLTGSLAHHYFHHRTATEDKYETKTTSDLNCALNLVRVEGTNTLQGTCTGALIWVYDVPGHSEYNSSTNKQITYQVSTELPDELLNSP